MAGEPYLYKPGVLVFGGGSTEGTDMWTITEAGDVSVEPTRERAERSRVGPRNQEYYLEAERPDGVVALSVQVWDAEGINVVAKTMRVGTAATTNQPLIEMPEGEGTGLPQRAWDDVTLTGAPWTGSGRHDNTDAVEVTLNFEGNFTEAPAYTVQL